MPEDQKARRARGPGGPESARRARAPESVKERQRARERQRAPGGPERQRTSMPEARGPGGPEGQESQKNKARPGTEKTTCRRPNQEKGWNRKIPAVRTKQFQQGVGCLQMLNRTQITTLVTDKHKSLRKDHVDRKGYVNRKTTRTVKTTL